MDPPLPGQSVCLVLGQVSGEVPLKSRVPAAFRRSMDLLYRSADALVDTFGGRRLTSPAIGYLTAWSDTRSALAFASAYQAQLLEIDWPATLLIRPEASEVRNDAGDVIFRGPRVRMGVHSGFVEDLLDGSTDEIAGGPVLYQLARVTHALHGGQIVLTESASVGLQDDDTPLRDLGAHRLNGVLGVGTLRELVLPGREAMLGPPLMTQTELQTNALARPSVFVGRDGDLLALRELAGFGVRLVTIIGPEGSGKSRLCRQYALLNREHYAGEGRGGVWRCDVHGSTVGELVRSVGNAMGIPMILGRTMGALLTQVGHVLAAHGRVLLILDEIEGDTSEIAKAVSRWLEMAPEARFMVGARRRLGIAGEVGYQLAPLPRPDPANLRNADAVRLFTLRAKRVNSRFQTDDLKLVADLVGGLDGNPLALEVAAGLMHAWSSSDLVLALRGKTGPAVQRVLGAAWEQLDEAERVVLSRCAIYPSGFDRTGAEAVVDQDALDTAAILGQLRRRGLVLSVADADAPEILRFAVGPWVRRYALGQLDPAVMESLWERFADRILETCEGWPSRCWGPDGPEVIGRISVEWFNLLRVVEWGISENRASAATLDRSMRALLVLAPVFQTRGPAEIHMVLLDAVLRQCDNVLGADPLLQVQILAARANAWRMAGRFEEARADLDRGADIADRWADVYGQALCLNASGLLLWDQGSPEEAVADVDKAATLFRDLDHTLRLGMALGTLGVMQMDLGDLSGSESTLTEAIDLFRSIDGRHFEGVYLGNLGLLYRRMGRDDESRSLYEHARQIHRDTGDVRRQAIMAMNLGALDFRMGDAGAARRRYEEARSRSLEVGDRKTEAACIASLGVLALDSGDDGEARGLLVQAIAINRDLGNLRGEAKNLGHLGLLHHLKGERDKAADYYRRAVRLAVQAGVRRQELTFLAFLGALEAQERNVEDARAVFDAATRKAEAAGEADLTATVETLSLSLSLLESTLEEDQGTVVATRAIVEARLDQRDLALGPRKGLQRFAIQVARQGFQPTSP